MRYFLSQPFRTCERNGKNLFAVQSDAEVFIAARFGFNASKLVIIPDVETYDRTDTELSGLQRPKPENPCMSVKASTMHDSMCFAKAVICSGNWLTASCATTKVPISNLRGAIVSRAQQRADPNAVCAQFPKPYQKGAYFYDLTDQSSVFFYLPLVWLQADFRIQRCEAKPHCPECDYFADDAFVVKDRVVNEP